MDICTFVLWVFTPYKTQHFQPCSSDNDSRIAASSLWHLAMPQNLPLLLPLSQHCRKSASQPLSFHHTPFHPPCRPSRRYKKTWASRFVWLKFMLMFLLLLLAAFFFWFFVFLATPRRFGRMTQCAEAFLATSSFNCTHDKSAILSGLFNNVLISFQDLCTTNSQGILLWQ